LKEKQHIPSLVELAFENRNKEYGAYVLLTTHGRRLRFSFLMALIIFAFMILGMGGWMMIPWMKHKAQIPKIPELTVSYDPKLIALLQEPPKLVLPKKTQQRISNKIRINEDETVIQKIESVKEIIVPTPEVPKVIAKTDTTTRKTEVESSSKKYSREAPQSDSVFYTLDQPPQFPGGADALYLYIYSNLRYPVSALHRRIQGTVNIGFVIKADGSIGKVSIVKGADPQLDGEAARIIAVMAHWKPAVYKGKAVSSMLIIPITFTLIVP
jgi:periplasmic protein TonB